MLMGIVSMSEMLVFHFHPKTRMPFHFIQVNYSSTPEDIQAHFQACIDETCDVMYIKYG